MVDGVCLWFMEYAYGIILDTQAQAYFLQRKHILPAMGVKRKASAASDPSSDTSTSSSLSSAADYQSLSPAPHPSAHFYIRRPRKREQMVRVCFSFPDGMLSVRIQKGHPLESSDYCNHPLMFLLCLNRLHVSFRRGFNQVNLTQQKTKMKKNLETISSIGTPSCTTFFNAGSLDNTHSN